MSKGFLWRANAGSPVARIRRTLNDLSLSGTRPYQNLFIHLFLWVFHSVSICQFVYTLKKSEERVDQTGKILFKSQKKENSTPEGPTYRPDHMTPLLLALLTSEYNFCPLLSNPMPIKKQIALQKFCSIPSYSLVMVHFSAFGEA